MNKFLIYILLIANSFCSKAQLNRYLVTFKNKNNSVYSITNPLAFLSQRAIDRRLRYNINIDSTDLPINDNYIEAVRTSGEVTILNQSKWMNQISIETRDVAALIAISNLPFVENTRAIASRNPNNTSSKFADDTLTALPLNNSIYKIQQENIYQYGASNAQIKIHQGDFLHNHGFNGKGMQMAVIDAGFYRYNTLPTFDSLNRNGQILGTWDFVNNNQSVSEDDAHGMHCLSAIGANLPGVFVGAAPKSSFYLFRTEDVRSEYPIEEHNFCVAAEKADSLGVDVCSVSLGYNTFSDPQFNYTYADMNGSTSISAKATNIAASKGLLMVIAAGNEGNGSWRYVITPADADSCMAVGAVDSLGNVANFSSYGPNSDGQIKPDVVAIGRNAVVANNNTGMPNFGNGTSYACPNMAGISTCLWQAFPEASNMKIRSVLKQSASNFSTPNNRIGFGIPNAKKAFVALLKNYATYNARFFQCASILNLSIKTDTSMYISVERKFPTQTNFIEIATLHNDSPFGMHDFEYIDNLDQTNYGSVQYRYKMKIGADTTFYMDSSTVNYLNPCIFIPPSANTLLISPNPVYNELFIKMERMVNTKVDVIIHNISGQKIFATTYEQAVGSGTKNINFRNFARGVYFVTVYLNDKKEVIQRIVKQ
jgi:subtilisin family serine protease